MGDREATLAETVARVMGSTWPPTAIIQYPTTDEMLEFLAGIGAEPRLWYDEWSQLWCCRLKLAEVDTALIGRSKQWGEMEPCDTVHAALMQAVASCAPVGGEDE